MQINWKTASALCAVSFAAMNLFYRAEMDRGLSGEAAMVMVFALSAPTLILYSRMRNLPILPPRGAWLLLGCLSLFCYVANVFKMQGLALAPNPGYAEALSGFEILILTLGATVLLKAHLSSRKLIGIVLCLAGFAALADWTNVSWLSHRWVALCLAAAVFQAIFALIARRLGDLKMQPIQMALLLHAGAGIFFGTHMLATHDSIPINWPFPMLYLGAAFFALLGTVFELRALSSAPNPGYAMAIVRSSALIIAAGGWLILGSELTPLRLTALVLCVLGTILIATDAKVEMKTT